MHVHVVHMDAYVPLADEAVGHVLETRHCRCAASGPLFPGGSLRK